MTVEILTSLMAACAAMWGALIWFVKKESRKLDECEKRHLERDARMLSMAEKIGNLEGAVMASERGRREMIVFCDEVIEKLEEM